MLGMAAAGADDKRIVSAEIEATIQEAGKDYLGRTRYEVTNIGRGTIFYFGQEFDRPVMWFQSIGHLGNWKDADNWDWCRTGQNEFKLDPDQSVTIVAENVPDRHRFGIQFFNDSSWGWNSFSNSKAEMFWSQ